MTLPIDSITDMQSFHEQCMQLFGFPSFYGRNMDAWIDCMSCLPHGDGMSRFTLAPGELLFIHVPNFEAFVQRVPQVSAAMLECVAFVNQRYIEAGDQPRLALVLE